MGAILGLGMTHVPLLAGRDEDMTRILRRVLADPDLPERYRKPDGWPAPMREEWGADEGRSAARRHREALVAWMRRARRALDDFAPDLVVIWGDDQYENFREDCVPAFSVLAYDSVSFQPWKGHHRGPNAWDEPEDKTFTVRGHRSGGKYLATALLSEGVDIAYAYQPLHHALGHAFANSILYLDYDRKGFPYPVVPFAVNAYGRWLIGARGVPLTPTKAAPLMRAEESDLDPPAPQPWRCFQVGATIGRALQASPWRVAIIASSSWSHSFLVKKNGLMFPDVESDRRYYEAFRKGNWELWRNTTIEEAEDRGHHELLNWFCLAGAMHALGRRAPDESVFLESWITNSDKVFAVFRPNHKS